MVSSTESAMTSRDGSDDFMPWLTHRYAVGHRDGAELTRRAPGSGNALLDGLGLAHQGNVAGSGFIPAGGDADDAKAARPADAMQPQLLQSGLPPN